MPETTRTPSNRTIFIIIAVCIALFAATVLLLLFTETGRSIWIEAASESVQTALKDEWDVEEELTAELKRIRQKGEPTTLDEIIPPQIPDEKNAAILYEKAFGALDLSDEDEDMLSDLSGSFAPASAEQAPAIEDLRSIVAENREVLELLRTARNRPDSRFSIDWSKGADFRTPFLADARWCMRILLADISVALNDRDTDRAVTDIETGLRLACAVRREPIYLAHLVGYWLSKQMTRAVRCLVRDARLSEDRCRGLYRQFVEVSFAGDVSQALATNRVLSLGLFEYVREHPGALEGVYSEGSSAQGLWHEIAVKPRLNAEKLTFLRYARQQMKYVEKPYRMARDDLRQLSEAYNEQFKKRPLAASFSVAIRTQMEQRDEAKAYLGLAQVGLALEAYRNETGRLPGALEEIPEVVKWVEIPKDPFSGEDFVYRPAGDDYLFYSIGRNLQDDAGEIADRADEADIVWRVGQ